MKADPPSILRLQLRHAGYDPLPAAGKAPTIEGWSQKFNANDDEIRLWDTMWQHARSTGVLARFCPAVDIDLLDPEAAEATEQLVRESLGEKGDILVRVGRPPKRLIPMQTREPFEKKTRLFMPRNGNSDDDVQRIEVLADGQQWIADGIHKDTRKPYRWFGGGLATTPREDLPYVCSEDLERLLDDIERVLVSDFGYTLVVQTNGAGSDRQRRRSDSRYGILNERALMMLDSWVPQLFPTAKKTKIGYRVKSADLGRCREEDLSLTTKGIKYFGDHDMGDPRQGRRTPIDVVMEWNHAEFADAVRWLEWALEQVAEPPPETEPEPPQDPPRSYRFPLKPFDTIVVSTVPSYLIKGIFPRTGLVVVWGPPKCGKSFWTFDAVMHIVLGREYRGRRVQQGAGVYLALEGGSGFAGRVEAWRRRHLAEHDQPVPFFLIDVSLDLIADREALIADIRDQLRDTMPAVVVVDTLNRAIQGDENSSGDMSKFIRAADALRAAFGCLVLIVHHRGVATNRPRGHTSLAGADDAQIAVERDKDGIITVTVEHMKDAEAGAKLACKLEPVELGEDADSDPLSSCIIVPAEGGAATGPKLTRVQRFAFELLQKITASEGITAPDEANLPAGFKICLADTWRKRFYETYPADKQDTKKKALFRATLDLEQAKLIELWREYVWARDNRDNSDF